MNNYKLYENAFLPIMESQRQVFFDSLGVKKVKAHFLLSLQTKIINVCRILIWL